MAKPRGYWYDLNNILKDLNPEIRAFGHFPTTTELRSAGRIDLSSAIIRYAGFNKLRQKYLSSEFDVPNDILEILRKESKSKQMCYWKDPANFCTELSTVVEELGHFPTSTELKRSGHLDIYNAAIRYHEGLTGLKKIIEIFEEVIKNHDAQAAVFRTAEQIYIEKYGQRLYDEVWAHKPQSEQKFDLLEKLVEGLAKIRLKQSEQK